MSKRKTICDLGMVTVDFERSDATTHESGTVFRLTFRHRSGQFTAELAAAMTAIIAHLKSAQSR